jgi:plasmid stabilization system protein ParE
MTKKPLIRAEAAREIEAARQWYDEHREGLGGEFLLSVGEAVAGLHRNPEIYPRLHRDLRRAPIRQFPYSIVYRILNQRVVVVSVPHDSRDPRRWQSRQ